MRKASLTLAAGAASAQGIAFLATLAAAAIYGPDNFGAYAYVIAISTALAPAATLRFEYGIVPAPAGQARPLAALALLLALATSALLVLLLVLLDLVGFLSRLRVSTGELLFVPLVVLTIATFNILTQVSLRQQAWTVLATRGVIQNTGIGGVQVVLGSMRQTSFGLLIGEVVGRAAGILLLAAPLARRARGLPAMSVSSMWRAARLNSRLTSAYLPGTVLDALSIALPVLLVGHWFGATAAGLLALALRILAAPVSLVGLAVGQAVQGVVGRRVREGDRSQLPAVLGLLKRLGVFALIASTAYISLGPLLIDQFFAQEWSSAAQLVPALGLLVVSGVVYNPLSTLYVVYEAWTAFLCAATARAAMIAAAGTAAHALGGDLPSVVWAMACALFVVDISACIYAVRLSR